MFGRTGTPSPRSSCFCWWGASGFECRLWEHLRSKIRLAVDSRNPTSDCKFAHKFQTHRFCAVNLCSAPRTKRVLGLLSVGALRAEAQSCHWSCCWSCCTSTNDWSVVSSVVEKFCAFRGLLRQLVHEKGGLSVLRGRLHAQGKSIYCGMFWVYEYVGSSKSFNTIALSHSSGDSAPAQS